MFLEMGRIGTVCPKSKRMGNTSSVQEHGTLVPIISFYHFRLHLYFVFVQFAGVQDPRRIVLWLIASARVNLASTMTALRASG